MKKIISGILLFAYIFIISAVCIYADDSTVISVIIPTKNLGVFENKDEIIFDLSFSSCSSENLNVQIFDINDKIVYDEFIPVTAGTTEMEFNFGTFSNGWYRIYIYDQSGAKALKDYAAFIVVPDFSTRKLYPDSPFALDAAVSDNRINKVDKFAEAYKLIGITQIRERLTYKTTAQLDSYKEAFRKNGISILPVYAKGPYDQTWVPDLSEPYNYQKKLAADYADYVNAWEIINEPDILPGITADTYGAFLKAASIGSYDGNKNAKKSLGAFCSASGIFTERLLQNGVMDYVDTYNVHTHNSIGTGYSNIAGSIIEEGRVKSTIYGGGKEIWVTESGARMKPEADLVPVQPLLKSQAAYAITSFVDSIANYGTEKQFWFLGRYHLEAGSQYGSFSYNDMPYPCLAAMSTLTYYLGKGDYLGEVHGTTGNAVGRVFDTGSGCAVVLYDRSNSSANVQIDTTQDATLVDIVGGTTERIVHTRHNKINVPVTEKPVIVVLNDEEPIVKYYKKSYEQKNEMEDISDYERVVVQPIFPSDVPIEEGEYLLEQGKEYTVTLKMYNFSNLSLSTSIEYDATSQITVTKEPGGARLAPNAVATTSITFKVNEDSCPMSGGMLILKPVVKKKYIAPVVAHFRIDDKNIWDVISETKTFDYFYDASNWRKNSVGSIEFSASGNTVTFKNTFSPNITSCWTYPYINMNEDLSDYKGFYFDISIDNNQKLANGNVYVNGILGALEILQNTPTRIYVPFDKFTGLDTSAIKTIGIGFTQFSEYPTTATVKVSNINFYKVDIEEVYKTPEINIEFENNKIYRVGNQPESFRATISEKLTDVKVYVNYKEYKDFTLDDNGLGITVNLKDLDYGAKNVIVTGRDRFNLAVYDEVNFYLSNLGEYLPKGAFF